MSDENNKNIPLRPIGDQEDKGSVDRRRVSSTGGIMSRFLGLGRALADSVRLIGDDSPVDAHLKALQAFYKEYNPAKVKEAKKILEMFSGREDIMYATLRKKYSVDEETFQRIVQNEDEIEKKKTDLSSDNKEATTKKTMETPKPKETISKRRQTPSKIFVVPSGATLMGIALQQNCSVRTLRRLNPELKHQTKLSKGQRLFVPASSGKKKNKSLLGPTHSKEKSSENEDLSKVTQKTSHVPVEFCAKSANVNGSLLVAPDFVMFEPAANDPCVKKNGILAYQFCIDIRDVLRIGVVSYMSEDEEEDEEEEENDVKMNENDERTVSGSNVGLDVEEEKKLKRKMMRNKESSSSHQIFGGSFLQLFWSHRTVIESRRRTSVTERYVLFKVSRAAIPGLISAVQAWIQAALRRKRDQRSRSMSINFTSDGGGMIRAISLEDLFKAIDRNRRDSCPIELMPIQPKDGAHSEKMEEDKEQDGDDDVKGVKIETATLEDAVLPLDVEKKTQIERIRSCELIELKATFVDKTELLTDLDAVAQIDSELPPSLRGETWRLLYSLVRDGQTFSTFLTSVKQKGPTIVVVKSAYGDIFGGYASQSWAVKRRGFFGTGECFLFRIACAGKSDCVAYRWTGMNDDFMMCTQDSIAMGCGVNGKFGFHLGEDFIKGNSSPCETFGNQCLTTKSDFDIVSVEVWGLTVH